MCGKSLVAAQRADAHEMLMGKSRWKHVSY